MRSTKLQAIFLSICLFFSDNLIIIKNTIENSLQIATSFVHTSDMKLDKFLWSKTKVDILKYLIFRRQGISIRALEHEIPWTFPAIKKQVDSLEESEVVLIDKDAAKWAITIHPSAAPHIRWMLLYTLQTDLFWLFEQYTYMIDQYFLWRIFWKDLELDLVIVHKNIEKQTLDAIKEAIGALFRNYFIETAQVVFMSLEEFQRRYRLADKFVLQLMRSKNN